MILNEIFIRRILSEFWLHLFDTRKIEDLFGLGIFEEDEFLFFYRETRANT